MSLRRPNFTRVPNDLFDLHMASLTECELKVMLFILRKTEGFNREKITVSLSKIAERVEKDRATVSRACKTLVEIGLIIATKNSADGAITASTYEPNFEDDLEEWGVAPAQHPVDPAPTGGVAPTPMVIEERKDLSEIKEITPLVPIPAPRKESQTLTPKQQQTVFLSRLKHGGVKLDWRHAEKKQAIEWLEGREESFEHILTALQLFLEDEYWKGEGLPWSAFKKQFLQFLEQALAAPAPEDSGVEVPATKANPPAAAVDAPSPAQSLNWLEEWNRLVPEQPTAPNSRKQLLVTFEAAGEDFRENFDKICEAARRVILDQGTKAAYLDLYWLCKYADGESAPNWHRLLFGNLRHMAVSRGAKSVSGPWVPGQPPPQGIWNDEDEATYRAWRAERIAAGEHHDPDLFAEEQVRAAKGGKP